MSLHDTIIEDAKKVFANEEDFAEPTVYHKRNGRTRPISAVVIREALGVLPEDGDVVYPMFEIHVANDPSDGIASDELNLGGYQLEFPDRVGQPPKRHSILKLLSHDEGMLVLECR
jgi:hypothetical protein